MNARTLTIAFLDVGQGDSTVVLLPTKDNAIISAVVVDCPGKTHATADYLHTAGVTHLPWVLLTHTDEDHLGGMAHCWRTSSPLPAEH